MPNALTMLTEEEEILWRVNEYGASCLSLRTSTLVCGRGL